MQDEEEDLLHCPFTLYIIFDRQKDKMFNAKEINFVKKSSRLKKISVKTETCLALYPVVLSMTEKADSAMPLYPLSCLTPSYNSRFIIYHLSFII